MGFNCVIVACPSCTVGYQPEQRYIQKCLRTYFFYLPDYILSVTTFEVIVIFICLIRIVLKFKSYIYVYIYIHCYHSSIGGHDSSVARECDSLSGGFGLIPAPYAHSLLVGWVSV